jgi:hypothetical protein
VPKNIVESRISAMPRNGRSARAGADGASGSFSGEELTATRSSLAAAADGGVTGGELGGNENNRIGRGAKERQTPGIDKDRKQAADMRACGGLPLKQNPYFCGRERFAVIPGQPAGLSPESITPVVIFRSDVVS